MTFLEMDAAEMMIQLCADRSQKLAMQALYQLLLDVYDVNFAGMNPAQRKEHLRNIMMNVGGIGEDDIGIPVVSTRKTKFLKLRKGEQACPA